MGEKKGIVISVILFILFFIVGIMIYDDYGVSVDEMNQVTAGHVTYKYLSDRFNLRTPNFYKLPDIHNYFNKYYGQAITFPTVILEAMSGFSMDTSTILRVRHLWNFLNYFFGVLCFSILIQKRFGKIEVTILSILMLIISPRIFAEAFYNDRDLLFFSWFLITIFFFFCFINKVTINTSILLGVSIAVSTTIRYFGLCLFIPFFLFIFTIGKKHKKNIIFVLLAFALSWYLLTPVAWENPINTFLSALRNFTFSSQRLSETNGIGTTLFMGKKVFESNLPRYYLPVWILITTPLAYIFLSLVGIFVYFKNLVKRTFEKNLIMDSSQIIILLFTLATVIIFRPTLYNGWRHFYFLYCPIVYFSLFGFSTIIEKTQGGIRTSLYLMLSISFLITSTWMFKNHPYQMVFFNPIAKNFDINGFEKDYWRLSSTDCLKYIAENDKNERIEVLDYEASLKGAKFMLPISDRNRLVINSFSWPAKYIVANYTNISTNELNFPFYTPIHHVKVDDMKIASVYQRDYQHDLWAQEVVEKINSNVNPRLIANVFDGDLNSNWRTEKLQNSSDYLDIEFKYPLLLNGLTTYIGEDENERPWSLQVLSSEDGINWQPVEIVNQNFIDYEIKEVKTKYLRIKNSEPSEKYTWAVYELLFHGTKLEDG